MPGEPIAIVGMGCRLPGAESPDELWRLLESGEHAISEVPSDRWSAAATYGDRAGTPGKTNSRWGGFLRDPSVFDARFFRMSECEACNLDPQQRILLELAWESLEDACISPDTLRGSDASVFIGLIGSDYEALRPESKEALDRHSVTGTARAMAANRISYFFDLHGPSLTVDTACSSSLVATDLACQQLRCGLTQIALVGAANLVLNPDGAIFFSQLGLMASDGRCKSFDAHADGFVRSDGMGMVVLKRLSEALRDRDHVYAAILGSAVNQDGRTNGIVAPSRAAQVALLRAAYDRAGTDPRRVRFVEAHGSGTQLGDLIELEALDEALGRDRRPGDRCGIGSIKSNLGHLEAAAGIAGLIKAALCLDRGICVPTVNVRVPNQRFDFERGGLRILTECEALPRDEPVVAGVSAFGFGGVNAHVVLQGRTGLVPVVADPIRTTSRRVIPVSARSESALRVRIAEFRDLAATLGSQPDRWDRFVRSATRRTAHLEHREAVVVEDARAARSAFARLLEEPRTSAPLHERRPGVVFVYSGHGSQWQGMARDLMRESRVFRKELERCDALLHREASWSLIDELRRVPGRRWIEVERVQPAIFAIQIALTAWWRSLGVDPSGVLGHSVGEVAAACAAGALDLEQGVRVVCARSARARERSGKGAMLAVGASVGAVRAELDPTDDAHVATIETPDRCVLSGSREALSRISRRLDRLGIANRSVDVDFAAHGPQMEEPAARLRDDLAMVSFGAPDRPFFSSTDGSVRRDRLCADYWARNLSDPVRFADAIETAIDRGNRSFLELSPHPLVTRAIRETLARRHVPGVAVASLRREEPAEGTLYGAIAELYRFGHDVDWSALEVLDRPERVPSHPFERRSYWYPSPGEKPPFARPHAAATDAASGAIEYEAVLEAASEPGRVDVSLPAVAVRGDAGPRRAMVFARAGDGSPDVDPLVYWVEPCEGLPRSSEAIARHLEALRRHLGSASVRARAPGIVLVTVGAFDPIPHPVSTALFAAGRSLHAEHPDLLLRVVDLPARGPLEVPLGSLTDPRRPKVLVRTSDGWRVPRWKRRNATPPAAPWTPNDRPILISGGLGGLGLASAERFVDLGARSVVLMGRSGPGAEASERIAAMRASGAEVVVSRCDVRDPSALRSLLGEIEAERGAIAGVVHAAGVLDDAPLLGTSTHREREVLGPKVDGADALIEALGGRPLEFFLLFSSAAGSLGNAGQSAYAAANGYLDGFAGRLRKAGVPATAIAWGPWAEIGLASERRTLERLERAGVRALAPGAALDAMIRVLSGDAPQVLVADVDWKRLDERTPDGPPRPDGPKPAAGTRLRTVVAGALGVDPRAVDDRTPLVDLGLDSLSALDLRRALEGEFGLCMTIEQIFELDDLRSIQGHLRQAPATQRDR